MTGRNPLLPPITVETPEPPDISDELLGDTVSVQGPESPLSMPHDPSLGEPWPRVSVTAHRLITVAGLHGGAGASTVASLFGEEATDAGQGWPVAAGWRRPLPQLGVVAVARTHYAGLSAADAFLRQWAAGQLPESRFLGLVLVDDGPRLLQKQSQEAKRLLRLTPRGTHIPWNEQWRVQPPDPAVLPRRLRRIVKTYRNLAHEHLAHEDQENLVHEPTVREKPE